MNIVQYLDEVGHTNITYQPLSECVTGATQKRSGTEVRFVTDQMTPGDLVGKPRKIGIVVWFDREHMERIQKERSNGG